MMLILRNTVSVSLLAVLSTTCVQAQTEAPAPTPTLWRFLGIPQAVNHTRAQIFNRRGNTPRVEKKPPLTNLADPANLESDVPAIKTAAEIKQAEDLKPQKIKAIKFLAEVGCGCYDKDEKVTKALMAAMEDCTEEVRVAAVEAIGAAANGECCAQCQQTSCCNEKIAEQLAKLAYEVDESGCYIEPSERVRQAATEALCICCPNHGPPLAPEEAGPIEGVEPHDIEGVNGQENVAPTPPRDRTITVPPSEDSASFSPAWSPQPTTSPVSRTVSSRRQTRSTASPARPREIKPVRGVVLLLDPARNLAHVHFAEGSPQIPVGTRLGVYARASEGPQLIGELEVTQAYPDSAHARPVEELELSDIRRSNWVVSIGR